MRQEQPIRAHPTGATVRLAGVWYAFMRCALVAALGLALLPGISRASPLAGAGTFSVIRPFVAADWQGPRSLPPRFRNHCRYDPIHGRWYCANHCGPDYQFYFCSPESFGCCHPGYGYCDWKGRLRCAP